MTQAQVKVRRTNRVSKRRQPIEGGRMRWATAAVAIALGASPAVAAAPYSTTSATVQIAGIGTSLDADGGPGFDQASSGAGLNPNRFSFGSAGASASATAMTTDISLSPNNASTFATAAWGRTFDFFIPGADALTTTTISYIFTLTETSGGATLTIAGPALNLTVSSDGVTAGSFDILGQSASIDFAVSSSGQKAGSGPGFVRSRFSFSVPDGVQFVAQVPEPATWLSMIVGFGMVGGVLRRRGAGRSVSL